MDIEWFRGSLRASTIGYAEHKIILNDEGIPCDYEYIDVNQTYELLSGFSSEELIGKRVTEVDPQIKDAGFNWIKTYGAVALKKDCIELTYYSAPLKRNYNVWAFSSEMGFFITIFFDITKLALKIEESEQRVRAILNSATEGIFGIDTNGKCTFCNKSALTLLGYKSEKQILGFNMHDTIHYHTKEGARLTRENCLVAQANKDGKLFHSEDEYYWRADGTCFPVEVYAHPQFKNDEILGSVITFFDITERKRAAAELAESNRSKLVLLANLPGVAYRCRFDDELTMDYLSEGCLELTGYKPEELLHNPDRKYGALINADHPEELYAEWRNSVQEQGSYLGEYGILTKDGIQKWVYEKGQAVYDKDGNIEALEGLIIDITERKEKEDRILYLNTHDALTGQFNRIYFDAEIERLKSKEYLPLSYIVSDINGLKLINEVFGHSVGNHLITEIGRFISHYIRKTDVLARTGGDEFSILMPNTDHAIAYQIMRQIQDEIAAFTMEESVDTLKFNLSSGCGTREDLSQDMDAVQKTAEEYMNKRKLLDRSSAHSNLLNSIKTTMYERSRETEEHAERLTTLSRAIGKLFELTQIEMDELELLAVLHDLGKIGIDDRILDKPEALTPEEQQSMRSHPEIGYRIAMASPELSSIAQYILAHHERWDGKGYPRGIKGESIPLLARILSVVDAFDAMTFTRAYRKAMEREEALAEIRKGAGNQFDPSVVDAFFKVVNS
ncbi:MAG: PAS domain S-box protein [Victivallales bacterium]|nr:PAS domain S-box protein [Victivallales bacterium]